MIPCLDARQITARDPATLEALRVAAEEIGFLTVTHTALTQGRVREVLDAYAAVFALPDADKRAIDMAVTGANRGWGAPGAEQVDPDANPDFKQVFDSGFEAPETGLPVYASNLWPRSPASFRPIIEAYFDDALQVAMDILRGIAEALGEDRAYFDDKFAQPMALLRGNYYPPRPDWAGAKDFGIAAHSDYGCVTLLATDGTPGLEVLGRDDAWHPLAADPGTFVINFGEMLEMWTAGRVKATQHRVIGSQKARLSVPLFVNPRHDTNVAPKGAAPILAGDHLSKRFNETYVHLKTA